MKALHRKLALGLAIGVASVGMFGAAALGAFGLEVSSSVGSAIAPVGSVLGAEKPDKFKGILDALVQKGVITQQQEDAILAAMKDAAGKDSARVHVAHDLFGAAAQYLGTTEKDLRAKLPGTSLGKIADGMAPAKSRAGLVAALTTAANADIDKAVADKRITADQATTLRSKVAGEITSLVDRTWPTKPTAAVRAPNLKSFLGEMSKTVQTFLGLSATDIATALRNGQSLGELANATKPNGRDSLIAALTLSANTRIDKAAADKKITTDQATTLKSKVGAAITTFVDRKFPVRSSTEPASPANGTTPAAPTTTKPTTPASPSPTPKEDR
ncbi:MAG: hypothetical protein E6H91_11145 [Chloroflexi bacterium]|nr:MAG: hypothetical protein E6H91_11145 [Chloroflexota bacterium]